MNWLVNKWYSSHPICYLFAPLSAIYRLAGFFRNKLYRLGLKRTTYFSVPIIIVGNITVGGTGKTPLVIWLATYLRQQGYRPGIVSRGYGGTAKQYPQTITTQSDPAMVGDEALLIAEKTHCPVVVDPQRVNAVQFLLEKNNCDIVISDDGLQHYALGRTIEIAVIDGVRGFGNQFCLPAGPLREPLKRLSKVNFIISNVAGNCHASEGWHPEIKVEKSCHNCCQTRRESIRGGLDSVSLPHPVCQQPRHDFFCKTAPPVLFSMCYNFAEIYNLFKPGLRLDSQQIKNQKIHAVAGIGNPQRFFDSLRNLGFSIIEHSFPDHYVYKKQDLEFGENAIVIMTEKDAVKCKKFANERYWCLPISASLPIDFAKAILLSLRGDSRSNPGL